MSNLSLFLKKNKKVRPNTFYAATKSIVDEKGEPVLWEIKPISTEEASAIRAACIYEKPVPGKKNMYRDKLDTAEYLDKMTAAAVVFPDLQDAELQDSYGVKTPEDLLKAIVDDPSEYADLQNYVTEQSGFDKEIAEDIEEAKN